MKTAKEVLEWFEKLYSEGAIYVWGANGNVITKSMIDTCYKNYKSNTYNRAYYDNKLKEGEGKIGADCSGAFCKVSGFDTTAKNYYAKCKTKGSISAMPKDKMCLVFRGSSASSISHIGLYCGNGYTIEMKSSKDNCVKSLFSADKWNYYGIPTWIDYSNTDNDNSNKIMGIDVSHHQKDKINFNELKKAGYSFVFARCGIRGSFGKINKDEYFDYNYKKCTENGLLFGPYIYSRATTTAMAEEEADKVYEWCKDKKITYPVAFDIEDNVMKNKNATAITLAFIKRMNSYGYPAIIYTGESFYKTYMDDSKLVGIKKWIAKYGKNDGGVYNPNIGSSIAIHQFTSCDISTPYYDGKLDRNIAYEDLSKMFDSVVPTEKNETSSSPIRNVVTASTLRIRKSATTRSETVGYLSKNEMVDILGYTDGWYLIDGGFISESYVSTAVGRVSANALNFRKSASVKPDNIIKAYPRGTTVKLLRQSGKWYFTPLGWCSGDYISVV